MLTTLLMNAVLCFSYQNRILPRRLLIRLFSWYPHFMESQFNSWENRTLQMTRKV